MNELETRADHFQVRALFLRVQSMNRVLAEVGWEEMVVLGAYAVNIKNIAVRDQGALLQLVLQKSSSGAASKKIWDFPAVCAVINYHWQHWAGWCMFAQALLFLFWLASTAFYVMLYIVRHRSLQSLTRKTMCGWSDG